ncbi:MAG: hypothetical protein ABFQ62_01190 [Patescibacteria group bacterium]
MTIKQSQTKHPKFIYQSFDWEIKKDQVECSFKFLLEPNILFEPKLRISGLERKTLLQINHDTIDGLVFHLGLMEIPSYWKATLSPIIAVKAGHLNKKQITWWRNLLMEGLGEFFFRNKIDPSELKFKFKIESTNSYIPFQKEKLDNDKVLLPLGGGKDSLVSLEVLSASWRTKLQHQIIPFALNPTQATLDILKINNKLKPVIAKRKIDPKLLELNKQGYFNGHTPFSAYLAFLTTLVATLQGIKNVAVSNEKSADEATVEIKSKKYNHQYSKTTNFENKFKTYQKSYLVSNLEYFSFLRPLYEIQIGKLFSDLGEKYFSAFRSCNKGQKKNIWCHDCPKCLFAFLITFPFVDEKVLSKKIFNKNIFSKRSLLDDAFKLVEAKKTKPWECVGTKEESILAFYLSIKKYQDNNKKLPLILKEIDKKILSKEKNLEKRSKKILKSWNKKHNLPEIFERILRKSYEQNN